jgi:DNA-binding beta-propeller fold protein YncE
MFDYNSNCIYVTSSSNTVSVFNPDGSSATVAGTWPNLQGPVAVGLFDNNPTFYVVVANATNNTFSTYNEDGTPTIVRPWNSFSTGTLQPTGIATDGANGAIVVSGTDSGVDELAMYSPIGGSITTQTAGLSRPVAVFYDPSGAKYYVANSGTGDVTAHDEQLGGLVNTIPPPAGLSKPVAITFVL